MPVEAENCATWPAPGLETAPPGSSSETKEQRLLADPAGGCSCLLSSLLLCQLGHLLYSALEGIRMTCMSYAPGIRLSCGRLVPGRCSFLARGVRGVRSSSPCSQSRSKAAKHGSALVPGRRRCVHRKNWVSARRLKSTAVVLSCRAIFFGSAERIQPRRSLAAHTPAHSDERNGERRQEPAAHRTASPVRHRRRLRQPVPERARTL